MLYDPSVQSLTKYLPRKISRACLCACHNVLFLRRADRLEEGLAGEYCKEERCLSLTVIGSGRTSKALGTAYYAVFFLWMQGVARSIASQRWWSSNWVALVVSVCLCCSFFGTHGELFDMGSSFAIAEHVSHSLRDMENNSRTSCV